MRMSLILGRFDDQRLDPFGEMFKNVQNRACNSADRWHTRDRGILARPLHRRGRSAVNPTQGRRGRERLGTARRT
jgi:hypothetical protein